MPSAAEPVNEEALSTSARHLVDRPAARHWSIPVVDRERDVGVVEAPGGEICAWLSVVCGPPHVEVFTLGVVALAWHGPVWAPGSRRDRAAGAPVPRARSGRRACRDPRGRACRRARRRGAARGSRLPRDPPFPADASRLRRRPAGPGRAGRHPHRPARPRTRRGRRVDAHLEAFATIGGETGRRSKSSGTGSSTRRDLTRRCRSSRGTGRSLPGTCSRGPTRRRTRRAVTSRHSAHVVVTAAKGSPRRC